MGSRSTTGTSCVAFARSEQGLRIGAVNPNLFQDPDYRLGSLCHPERRACAQMALDHCLECIEIAEQVGSTASALWLADGTNYPGQDDLRDAVAAAPRRPRASSTPPCRRA